MQYRPHEASQAPCDPENEFPKGIEGLVFDVDGVLIDSRASNMEYYNLVRRAVQLSPLTAEQEAFCHMATVHQALEHIIPPDLMAEAEKACRAIDYHEQILPMLTLEPGVVELLHWLKLWDVRLAVFTNRTSSVEDVLRYFGIDAFFDPVMNVGNTQPKPYPDGLYAIQKAWGLGPCNIAFLGDSRVDEQAAHAAGVPFWAFGNPSLNARLHFDDFFKMITMITPLVEGR